MSKREKIRMFQDQILEANIDFKKWENDVRRKYRNDEYICIIHMLTYHLNKYQGFDDCNDENVYAEIKKIDESNTCLNSALDGAQILLRINYLQNEKKNLANDTNN
jgi:hypothetical protein